MQHQPFYENQQQGAGGGGGYQYQQQATVDSMNSIQNEIMMIKQEATLVRNAVLLLQDEKENLRKAIRKLKFENGRMKLKIKTLNTKLANLAGDDSEDVDSDKAPEVDMDYDDLKRDYYLIGGIHDPLSLRYEVAIRDNDGVQHKSAERFYWYKMAEHFEDNEAKEKIQQAPSVHDAEEAMREIANYNDVEWNKMKLDIWKEGQRLKLDQVRWIANLLVLTKETYLAVASEDKFFGTGWRKVREEASRPLFWDGQNEGGKALMQIRHEMKKNHQWSGPQEEEESNAKMREMMRFVWRRIDPSKRKMGPFGNNGGRAGGMGMSGGGYGRMNAHMGGEGRMGQRQH